MVADLRLYHFRRDSSSSHLMHSAYSPRRVPPYPKMVRFAVDHTLYLNVGFGVVAAILLWLHFRGGSI